MTFDLERLDEEVAWVYFLTIILGLAGAIVFCHGLTGYMRGDTDPMRTSKILLFGYAVAPVVLAIPARIRLCRAFRTLGRVAAEKPEARVLVELLKADRRRAVPAIGMAAFPLLAFWILPRPELYLFPGLCTLVAGALTYMFVLRLWAIAGFATRLFGDG